ncbi:lanthionine synthetase LanC family protein [Cohnella sp. GCM10020058]|uniref:lanthionine synthetase LanC family protein n=1 Tax=Cohnella sp. GCM10020058 TaxID=3317330 RepID=UPI00363C4CD7
MSDHTHAIGKPFAFVPQLKAADLIEAAHQAHRYIEQFGVSDPDGYYWTGTPDANIDLGFENGAAGLSYFYLELFKTTGNGEYLRIAQEGFRYLCRHWRKQLRIQNPNAKGYELNVNSGVGSIGVALLAYYKETRDTGSFIALQEIAEYLSESAERGNGDVSWTGLPYYAIGDAGIALLLLRTAIVRNDEKLHALAVASAKTILKSQRPHPRGGQAWDVKPPGYPHNFPNFVIGTSGIGYAMSVFYEHTKDEDFLSSAAAAAEHLRAISVPLSEGRLVPLTDDPEERTLYLGSCHGAGGTSKIFYQLYRMTGDDRYKREIEEMSKGMLSLDAPELQSSGYWNNTCICCGTASILQFHVALYAAFGNRKNLEVAKRCAQVLLGEARETGNGAIAWPLAETRLEPDNITLNKGYMHGAAGIASALLQLFQMLKGAFEWNRLIDDPYPAHGELNPNEVQA